MKLMTDEKWVKFTMFAEKKIERSSISRRRAHNEINYNTLNKTWETLKNIMIEAADQVFPKSKKGKKRKVIKVSTTREYKIAKSLNKIYRFIKVERIKSLKYIKSHEIIKKEERKLSAMNYSINKIFA